MSKRPRPAPGSATVPIGWQPPAPQPGSPGHRAWLHSTTALCGGLALGLATSLLAGQTALANPQGGAVAGGAATITQTSPTRLDITQTTAKGIINWQSFNIGAGQTTTFVQPSASSVTWNYISDPSASSIKELDLSGNPIGDEVIFISMWFDL